MGAASYNIFTGIYVAVIFGAGFFFDLFFPERKESNAVRLAWKICAVLACVFALADALTLTIIVTTKRSFVIADAATLKAIATRLLSPNLIYKKNGKAVASVCLLWPGFVFTVCSCVLLFMSHQHDYVYGPKSTHVRVSEINAQRAKEGQGTPSMSETPTEQV